MEDDDAGFSVGFAIDTDGAFAEVLRFAQMFDDRTADIIRRVAEVEKSAEGMMQFSAAGSRVAGFASDTRRALASVQQSAADAGSAIDSAFSLDRAGSVIETFAAGATREMRQLGREKAATEKQIEALIRTLDREAASLGKTKDELREARIEQLSLTAAQQGNTDLADRLFAAARRRRFIAEDLAETEAAAAQRAAAAHEQEAQALRDAAHAHQLFETRVRAGVRAMQEEAAAARALELERTAQQARDAAFAFQRFETHAREMARAAREAEAAEGGLAREAAALRATLDPMYAAQQRFDAEMERADWLLGAGVISQREYAQAVQHARDVLNAHAKAVAGTAAPTDHAEASTRRLGGALTQLSFQLNDVVTMGMAGSGVFQIVATQAGQVFQVFQMAEGGAKALATELWTLAASAAPIAGVVAVTVGPVLAATAAWYGYAASIHEFEALAQGAGRTAGVNAREMEQIAVNAADAANITVGAARTIETGYIRLGAIGASVLPGLIALTMDFAAAAGGDAQSATRELGAAFESPVKGAEELTAKFGVLTQAQVEHIRHLVEQNDLYGAQQALLKGLEPAFDGAAEHATGLALAWRSIRNYASEAWEAIGHAIDVELGGGSLLDKLQKARRDRTSWLGQTYGMGDTSAYDAQIASLEQQLRTQQTANNQARQRAQGQAAMRVVDSVTGASTLQELRRNQGLINGLLADGGRAAGLNAEQLARARTAQEQYAHAVRTFLPDAEKQQRLAQLDLQLAKAHHDKNPSRIAALTARRSELESAGKLITATQAETQAIAAGTRTRYEAAAGSDRHAAQLVREADAAEAQIAGLYRLADAYTTSGAAALLGEARVKAETAAIRKRGDVAAFVDRETRLATAQQAVAAQKSAAAMRDQAAQQEAVNAAVAEGTLPAALAAEQLRDRLADLPLLAAREATATLQGKAGTRAFVEATKALEAHRAARDRLTRAERDAQLTAALSGGKDQLAIAREELRLVGSTEAVRLRALATMRAMQEVSARGWGGQRALDYIRQQEAIAETQIATTQAQDAFNASLSATATIWDTIAANAANAGRGMQDAFGQAGRSVGESLTIVTGYFATQARLQQAHDEEVRRAGNDRVRIDREQRLFAIRSAALQVGAYGDMAAAAAGFFDRHSKGYRALMTAERVFRAVELAMSVRNAAVQLGLIGGVAAARTAATGAAIATDAGFTAVSVANAGVRASADGVAAMAKTAASAPFPFNLAGMAVMAAALASIGIATGFIGGGGRNTLATKNDGTGTVLGDPAARSESLKRAIDGLKDVDTLTLTTSREIAATLHSIDHQISGVAALVVRAGNVNADATVATGFRTNTVGKVASAVIDPFGLMSKLPVIGGVYSAAKSLVASLFGTKSEIVANGLHARPQTLGSVLGSGFDADYYSDVKRTSKFLGIKTGSSYATSYAAADPALEQQFTLVLRSFAGAIGAAAKPLGEATDAIEHRLSRFVIDLGKIDLKGLTGAQIEEKLGAIFGAAADRMASTAFPAIARFQKVGEGTFETLVRVASTVEAVTASLDMLGTAARSIDVDAKMALAGQFSSVGALTTATQGFFDAFYSAEEQAAARQAQLARVFDGLGLAMPATLAAFRQLVAAQDLTTAAGQATYATLLQLAPAFAALQEAMGGTRRAADVLAERQDLERQLLQLGGDTAALRALDLAKVDVSNRALQQQVWAVQDAQKAADEAAKLRDAWKGVSDSITDEVRRIRGVLGEADGASFAVLQGRFNAATLAARGGDIEAARTLPGLSQSLLTAAEQAATSRQELDRVRAQTAASLESTSALVAAVKAAGSAATAVAQDAASAAASATGTTASAASVADCVAELRRLREELATMRTENNKGHAATAGAAGRAARVLENVSGENGGNTLSVAVAA